MTSLPAHPSNLASPRGREAARANDAALDAAEVPGLYEAVATLGDRPEGFALFILSDLRQHFKIGFGTLWSLGFKYWGSYAGKFLLWKFPAHSK